MTAKPPPATPAQPAPLPDQADMTPAELAEAILANQIARPRITSVRRLAEALLAKGQKKSKKKGKKKPKSPDKGVRKLALIPGQKGR